MRGCLNHIHDLCTSSSRSSNSWCRDWNGWTCSHLPENFRRTTGQLLVGRDCRRRWRARPTHGRWRCRATSPPPTARAPRRRCCIDQRKPRLPAHHQPNPRVRTLPLTYPLTHGRAHQHPKPQTGTQRTSDATVTSILLIPQSYHTVAAASTNANHA